MELISFRKKLLELNPNSKVVFYYIKKNESFNARKETQFANAKIIYGALDSVQIRTLVEILKIERLRVDSSMIKMNFYDIPNTYFVI